jgi:hypothetical protein
LDFQDAILENFLNPQSHPPIKFFQQALPTSTKRMQQQFKKYKKKYFLLFPDIPQRTDNTTYILEIKPYTRQFLADFLSSKIHRFYGH